jgi:hypothetical protein
MMMMTRQNSDFQWIWFAWVWKIGLAQTKQVECKIPIIRARVYHPRSTMSNEMIGFRHASIVPNILDAIIVETLKPRHRMSYPENDFGTYEMHSIIIENVIVPYISGGFVSAFVMMMIAILDWW